jgi:class 3 adenylate cyclase/tetratricopeptide (TPR) repeat protein
MDFLAVLDQVIDLLQQRGRLAYRTLKRQFDLDDEVLADLKEELIDAQRVAVDEDGRILVWTGAVAPTPELPTLVTPTKQLPDTAAHPSAPGQSPLPELPLPDAERRQLTVMFCDLVGSTPLAGRLDPEELREVVRAYQTRAAEVIQQYQGYIAQYLGDGLLVYFGWPQAHEDDAHRAVHAGLGIVEAVDDLNMALETTYGVQLAVRLGIHTGPVVVGEMGSGGRHENLALGETPNIAARLEGLAQPGTVLMSDETRRLVAGAFDHDDLGQQDLKGVNKAVQVFRVRGVRTATSRFDAMTTTLTPMVGREVELALLMRCWEQVLEGEGQVMLLNGPPGIGKSRLAQALCARLTEVPHLRLRYQCSPYHLNSALYPIATQLTRAMRLPPDAAPGEKLDRLEALVTQARLPVEETVALFAAMLSIPVNGRYPPLALNAQRQKDRTLALFAEGLVNLSRQEPVLFLFEDVHWSDPTSLEALGRIIDRVQDASVLMVLTCRPEFVPPWSDAHHVTTYTLNRLSRRQTVTLVGHVTAGKELPAEVVEQIVAKTDGIPMFVAELTRHVLESEWLTDAGASYTLTGALPPLAIPSTLQDSLMARLDRLAGVKDVVQLGATIGREFDYGLLAAVSPRSEAALQAALGQLCDADLLAQRGQPPEATYRFKHALIQDAAYQSSLRSTRQQAHQRIAQVLEVQFPEIVQTQPALVGYHALHGAVWDKALLYLKRAGFHAREQSAYRESLNCLEQALEALSHLPDTRDKQEQAIDLRLALRSVLVPLQGFAQNLIHLQEAERLAEALDDPYRLGCVCGDIAGLLYLRRDYDRALAYGQRTHDIATALGDVGLQVLATHGQGQVYLELGDYPRCRAAFEWIVTTLQGDLLYERFGRGNTAAIQGRLFLVRCLNQIGAFAEGLIYGQEALAMAEQSNRPYERVSAYTRVGQLHLFRGHFDQAIPLLERSLALSQEADVLIFHSIATSSLALAYARTGRTTEALALVQQSGEQFRLLLNILLCIEVYLLMGHREEASRLALRTLDISQERQERGVEAQALWLLGEVAMHHNAPEVDQAAAYYRQALALADELGMRPLQAHCHRGLGALYSQTGQAGQAYNTLSTAIEMYRNMGMTFWLPETEAMLVQVETQ